MDLQAFKQYAIDTLSPRVYPRWMFALIILITYLRRVFGLKSHIVITYIAGVYLLHSFVLFVTPKDSNIPDPFENDEDESYNPKNIDNDFRPYVRKLPELLFWQSCVQIMLFAYFLTFFPFTDIPVHTPILIAYSVFIVIFTAYKLWNHSKKFKYKIFSLTKSTLDE